MKILIHPLIIILCLGASSAFAEKAKHVCASQVRKHAVKLFALHYELDEATAERSIDDEVIERSPVKAPDGKRKYAVLETTAFIGKMGLYRMRFLFAVLGNSGKPRKDCILMGQEILDLSSL